jgi:YidC/Oxa1 family membrane protein insertase
LAEIQNPNQQGGGQDSRTILAFSTIFLLMFLGLQYFKQKNAAPAPPAQQQQQAAKPSSVAAPPLAGAPAVNPGQGVASVKAEAESETVVENELYRIRFSNRGGQVTSWILKKYTDDGGKPLDLVNREAAPQLGYPLSLHTYDAGLTKQLSEALYEPSATGALATPNKLSFNYAEGGLSVTKTFSFDSSYVVTADIVVTNNGTPVNAMLAWPSGLGDQETLQSYNTNSQFDTSLAGKSDYESPKKVVGGATLTGDYDYAGISDLYFAAIFLPDVPSRANIVSLHNNIRIPRNRKTPDPAVTDQASVLGAAVGDSSGHTRLRLFAGPKVISVLASVRATSPDGNFTGPSLEPIINFGWLKIIAKPFFLALRWIYQHIVSNWGWAILVLTLFINLAMLPTRVQMMKSALKMQRIQPEMDAIKNRYKNYKMNDPRKQEMNKEIFDLQKREGVNMFGGCLPMLVQMPLLFGFYKMLSNVIELRHANWLWLHDLAAPDPLHILPVFFIVSMFLVQFLTPSPGVDPAQQKMMAFTMPVFFGFMTWNLASGLALYWSFGNIINVIQQYVMNQTSMGKEMKEIAARRNAKRALKGTVRR